MQTQTQTQPPRVVESQPAPPPAKRENFVVAMANKLGMDPQKFWNTIRSTVFAKATDEECNALLMIAHEYGLNPLLKEIYAFKTQDGGIMPMVPIDGWITMVNRNPLFAGYQAIYPPEETWLDKAGKKCPPWIEVVMFRRDSDRPYPHREYLDECFKETGPWKSHPKRMLKHKAFIQSARYALGFSGIYDEDEARNMIDITPSGYEVLPSTPEAPDTSEFDRLADDLLGDEMFATFLDECARASGTTVEGIKVEGAKDFASFKQAFDGWAAKQKPASEPKPKRARESAEERAARIHAELNGKPQEQVASDGPPPIETVNCPHRGVIEATECFGCDEAPTCAAAPK